MGFLRRRDDQDPEQADEVAAISSTAEDRLRVLGAGGSLFTSGLSVNEFALLRRLGPQPVAQVMGASVVRTGWQYLPALPPGVNVIGTGMWSGPSNYGYAIETPYTEASPSQVRNYKLHAKVVCELDTLSEAWNLARRRALDRLREEALEVGADAVVGVHLRRGDHDLGRRTIEYVVTGTAIRLPDSAGTSSPTLTDVSVQDYWRLRSLGRDPVALIAATSVVFASAPLDLRLRRLRTTASNQELQELSEAFHAARESVRSRLLGQVADAQGEGAVGVEFTHSIHREKLALASSLSGSVRGWQRGRFGLPYRVSGHSDVERRGWVITMHAAGTAIRDRQSAPPATPIKTTVRLDAP